MKKMSLRAKLWIGCGSLLVILFALGAAGFQSALTTGALVRTVQFNVKKQNLAAAIELAVEKEKVGGRDALLHNDTSYLSAARADYHENMAALEPLLSTPTSHRLFSEIRDAGAGYDRYVDESIELLRSGRQAQALEVFYGSDAQTARTQLRRSLDELVKWYGNLAADAETNQLANSRRATTLILIFGCLGMAAGAGVAMLVIRSLISSIVPIVNAMAAISDHDLCIPDVEVHTGDELGRAGLALNTMKANLAEMVRSIARSAEQLSAATEEMSHGAQQSSDSAHREADQATQTASAMQEISATVSEVARHAERARDAASNSAEAARHGGKTADETLATMSSIAESQRNVADRVLQLGKSSEQIGNIVAVITEIAGQTNLLALNAAIEAARAGEQGRGFAVVAGEVRRLAERTATATQEIASMIQTIQAETKVAVEAIDRGNREVELGVKKTGDSGRALAEIIGMSEEVGQMIAQIAAAASQQLGAVEQISSSVSQISTLTQTSSVSADQTAKACAGLSGLAAEMQRLVNEFRIDDEEAPGNRRPGTSARRRPVQTSQVTSPRPVVA